MHLPPHRLRSLLRRSRGSLERGESGQALVEFAIILPLLVMIFFFAQWFWEVVQIKLKVQETARYAAWEPTAYRLHDYNKGRSSLVANWQTMRTQVTAEAMLRYADMDSARAAAGTTIWSATWTPPVIFMMNQQEELIYGGNVVTSPFVQFIFKIAGQGAGIVAGLLYGWLAGNPYAAELAGGFSGAMKDVPFGATEWGFNDRGYNLALVSTYVKNNWSGMSLLGKYVMGTPGVFISERNGVMVDAWNLQDGGDAVHKGTMFKQVERMYLMNSRTRKKARQLAMTGPSQSASGATSAAPSLGVGLTTLRTLLSTNFGITMTSLPPGLEPAGDLFRAALVSKNYHPGMSLSGKHRVSEDMPQAIGGFYETAPMSAENSRTLWDRGDNFMGCKQPEKLGCTHTLGQDNPFGDYLVRE